MGRAYAWAGRLIAASVDTHSDIGSEFVGYRIEELIGHGGMGVVYRAYDLRLKRTVALKLVAPELAADAAFRERFSRETELAMSLEHPNVVPIHDAGDVDGRLYLAMRHVQGRDLGRLLREEGALDPGRALAICRAVAAALDAAHAKGLVHRDVKPSNVLLDEMEHVYLADFGLTRRLDDQSVAIGEGRSIGTAAYLAPEQIEGGPIDGRADVYALGCLLYECLTGRTPFAGVSGLALAWAHLEEEPPRASERNRELPDSIDGVFAKALAKEPAERYATCGELIDAAEHALGLRTPPLYRRRKLMLVASVLLLAIAAAIVAALAARDGGRPRPLVARKNTVVRIDPATNHVTAVVDVGERPEAVVVSGDAVWVYNHDDATVSEIDPETNTVAHVTQVSATPDHLALPSGPVLVADDDGAWAVGVDPTGVGVLTRVLADGRGQRIYRFAGEPIAVASGFGAVWLIVDRADGIEVRRVDPATGHVEAHTRYPISARIDSLATGYGAVWALSSLTANLYRLDRHTAKQTGRIDLAYRAGRPVVGDSSLWIPTLYENAGWTARINPGTVKPRDFLSCCGPAFPLALGFGSAWTIDPSSGTVARRNLETFQLVGLFRVTPPTSFGNALEAPCLSSIATGAKAVWITVAAPFAAPTCAR